MWDWVLLRTRSRTCWSPDLSEDQRARLRQVLDGMLREALQGRRASRHLRNPVNIGIRTKWSARSRGDRVASVRVAHVVRHLVDVAEPAAARRLRHHCEEVFPEAVRLGVIEDLFIDRSGYLPLH